MTLPTFKPAFAPSTLADKPELRIIKTDFGDGYTQATRDGLNHQRRVATLRWEIIEGQHADEIEAFLKERGGDRPFLYRVPREDTPTRWTCADWTITRLRAGLASVDAVFRQDFGLAS